MVGAVRVGGACGMGCFRHARENGRRHRAAEKGAQGQRGSGNLKSTHFCKSPFILQIGGASAPRSGFHRVQFAPWQTVFFAMSRMALQGVAPGQKRRFWPIFFRVTGACDFRTCLF
jgi:hypothetical protein